VLNPVGVKNSLFDANGQKLGERKCLAIREDRLYGILTQLYFCEFSKKEFFNTHSPFHSLTLFVGAQ